MNNPDNEIPSLILAQFKTRNKITLKQLMDVIDYEKVDINRALNALYKDGQLDRDIDHGSYVYRLSGGSEPAFLPKAPKPKPAPKAEPEPEPASCKIEVKRKPFSVTETTGYKTGKGKITLFLDRQIHARSITLSAERIKALAEMAVAS